VLSAPGEYISPNCIQLYDHMGMFGHIGPSPWLSMYPALQGMPQGLHQPQDTIAWEGANTIRKGRKCGRNELCPCGSGQKYKQCCGRP